MTVLRTLRTLRTGRAIRFGMGDVPVRSVCRSLALVGVYTFVQPAARGSSPSSRTRTDWHGRYATVAWLQ